jgi:signal transduction histidine kinase
MRLRPVSLRTRLMASAVLGAVVTLAILVATFNLLLDVRLRADGDNVLRERAVAVLRSLSTVDGRLSVTEAPDQGTIDSQTWIFAGERELERPASVDPRNRWAARSLGRTGGGFMTVNATDTRMAAVPVRQSTRRLGTVVVAASLTPYESTASSALLGSVALGLIVLPAVAGLTRWLIRRALRPVAVMTTQAADWGEHDLSRRFFAREPHDELSALASVFDRLLGRLAQSLRREQHLTAEISHELRTPLAKILAETELAAGRERSSRQHGDALKRVANYADQLQRVLDTLLASARAGITPNGGASDARDSAERAAHLLRERLAEQGKSIEVLCRQPTTVALDAEVVERILSPLIENAARFAEHRIVVEIERGEEQVIFDVLDDGCGVDPSDRERIFEPGYRGGAASEEAPAGVGLGLPLSRRLARAAGGEVEALDSRDGARFTIRLPA